MDTDKTNTPADDTAFDETWYLSQNPGIAEAVLKGTFASGREHYVRHGRAEGRHPAPMTKLVGAEGGRPMHHRGGNAVPAYSDHNWTGFLSPTDLVTNPVRLTRVAMIGTPLMRELRRHDQSSSDCQVDLMWIDPVSGELCPTPVPPGFYDCIVIHIPLRDVIAADALWHIPPSDIAAHEVALQQACAAFESALRVAMQWNRKYGLLTFVANYFVPQRNTMGRLFPRYDIRNPEHFIDRLNQHLETVTRQAANAYVLDLDGLSASFGRRLVQDDAVFGLERNSLMPFDGTKRDRIEPMAALIDHYDIQWHYGFQNMVWAELTAMYRTVRETDAVRLVVVDPDNTLWNGSGDEASESGAAAVEGWPTGLAEALLYLKKRGIRLAIVCRGEASRIREMWPKILGGGLRLEDFAAVVINHSPKPGSMGELLKELSLPSRQVVFIDGDPAEREAMRLAFPDMRVLGRYPYYLRRILLWSPETEAVPASDRQEPLIANIRALLVSVKDRTDISWPMLTSEVWTEIERVAPDASREILSLLWVRAMDNDITVEQAEAIRRLCMAIAISGQGAGRIGEFSGWDA